MKLPCDVKKIIETRYRRHHKDWLCTSVTGGSDSTGNSSTAGSSTGNSSTTGIFPVVINLDIPSQQQALQTQEQTRAWISAWQTYDNSKQKSGHVEWTERNWHTLGTQRVPAKLILDTPEDAALLIGRLDEWTRMLQRIMMLSKQFGNVADIASKHCKYFADCDEIDYLHLADMLIWLRSNPASGLYPRQIPLAGVDTKWIESREKIITDMLSVIRGEEYADFYTACGLKSPKPQTIQMRILDKDIRKKIGGLDDIAIPADTAIKMAIKPALAFIVENKQTGLAFRDLPGAVVIMGLGYGVDLLADIPFLSEARMIYWGDIDTHGFAILSRARKHFRELESILMDEETLVNHRRLWCREPKQHTASELPYLTDDEQKLYRSLKDNTYGQNVRLEQERIRWDIAENIIKAKYKVFGDPL